MTDDVARQLLDSINLLAETIRNLHVRILNLERLQGILPQNPDEKNEQQEGKIN